MSGTVAKLRKESDPVGLLDLPPELVLAATKYLGQRDRRRVMQSCSALHVCVQHQFYEYNVEKNDYHALWWACVTNNADTANLALTLLPQAMNRPFQKRHQTRTPLSKDQQRHKYYDIGATPLSVATNRGNIRVTKMLIKHGADVNCPNPILNGPKVLPDGRCFLNMAGWYPVHSAIKNMARDKQHRILKLLVTHGADINRHALPPGDVRNIQEAEPPILTLMEPHFPDMAPFQVVGGSHIQYKKELGEAWARQIILFEDILCMGANPDLRDCRGRTLLMRCLDISLKYTPKFTFDSSLATGSEKDEQHAMVYQLVKSYIKSLIRHGADVNAVVDEAEQDPDPEYKDSPRRKSVLHLACRLPHGHDTLAQSLVRRGCNVNIEDTRGLTPIFEYCNSPDSTDVLRWLLDKGANVNHRDKDGRTPLHHAIFHRPKFTIGADKLVMLLVERGADITIKDNEGMTAENLAAQDPDPEAKMFPKRERERRQRLARKQNKGKNGKNTQDARRDQNAQTSGGNDKQQARGWPWRRGNPPQKNHVQKSEENARQQTGAAPFRQGNPPQKNHAQANLEAARHQAKDLPFRQGNLPQKNHAQANLEAARHQAKDLPFPQGNPPQKNHVNANGGNDKQQTRGAPWKQAKPPQNNKHGAPQGAQKGQQQSKPGPNTTNQNNKNNKNNWYNNHGNGRQRGRGRGPTYTWIPNPPEDKSEGNRDAKEEAPVPPLIDI